LNYPKGRQPVVFVAASDIHHDGRLHPQISSGREIIGSEVYHHGDKKTDFPNKFGGFGVHKNGDVDFFTERSIKEFADSQPIVNFPKRAKTINVMGGVFDAKTADDYSLEKSERMAREFGTKLLAKRPFLKQPPAQNPQGSQALPESNMPAWRFPLKKTMDYDCPLCYEADRVDIVLKPCGHAMCTSCFRESKYINTENTCPLCKTKIVDFLPFIPPVDPAID
jgi:hypothetical protein